VKVDGEKYDIAPQIYSDNIVSDRTIILSNALIVPDEKYTEWVKDDTYVEAWNVMLKQEAINEKGLLQALMSMEEKLESQGIAHMRNGLAEYPMKQEAIYESYLQGIGRNLYYTVASSYLTIYLGLLFMVIANTVIGLKYLMHQRANKHRYVTLLLIGATIEGLCKSARAQIRLFFTLAITVAVCNGIFLMWSMFTSFLKLPTGASVNKTITVMACVAIAFVIIEIVYILVVERISNREIQALQVTERR